MTIESINIEQTIESTLLEVKKDKSLSPGLVNSINLLVLIIKLLISRLGLNSTNSSLPPSTNNPRRTRGADKKKRKKKSSKSVGGQPGHEGTTLTQYEEADEVIELSVDRRTLPDNESFKKCEDEIRQVLDINLDFIVREYRAEVLEDSKGNQYVAEFPNNITKAIQYGSSVKAFAVYMSQYQLIPYNRVQEVFKDQFGLELSQGSLSNFNKEAYEKLESFEAEAMASLSNSKVLHADETGIKIDGELAWMHVLSDNKTTIYFAHEKRGKDAIEAMNIIPRYSGVLCHDHWKPYLGYKCIHSLCNAHHLRELQWVIDFKDHKWAKSMKRFLLKLNELTDEYGGVLPDDIQKKKIKRYREILSNGKRECPIYLPAKGSKGSRKRPRQTKERNLLDRLINYEDQVLLFIKNKDVPFTNNQAERDIRMVKVHQKISGQFKSMRGAKHFCRIRGYLMSLRKRGHAPLDKLQVVFDPELAE